MSDNLKLGQIITTPQNRDAIHIAVAPVKAGEEFLEPGERVCIEDGVAMASRKDAIGVVDPFLNHSVKRGETFWLFLFPGTITALRHEWAHPAFPVADADTSSSEARLRAIAADLGVSYEEVLWAGQSDEFAGGFGNEIEGDCEIKPVFWEDIERVTGKSTPPDKRPTFFRCAC